MTHVATPSLFLRASTGGMTPAERRVFDEHLAACDACRVAWDTASSALGPRPVSAAPLRADPGLPARIRAIADGSGPRRDAAFPAALRWSLSAAAALALGIYLGYAAARPASESLNDAAMEFSSSLSGSDTSTDWLTGAGEGRR